MAIETQSERRTNTTPLERSARDGLIDLFRVFKIAHPEKMPTIAYLANQFPSQVEPYVPAEIRELRSRGFEVIPGSARASTRLDADLESFVTETVYLQPLRLWLLVRAAWLCLRRFRRITDLFERMFSGTEAPGRRVRALLHTWLGAYYALQLEGRGVDHIHVHHGYFASW